MHGVAMAASEEEHSPYGYIYCRFSLKKLILSSRYSVVLQIHIDLLWKTKNISPTVIFLV